MGRLWLVVKWAGLYGTAMVGSNTSVAGAASIIIMTDEQGEATTVGRLAGWTVNEPFTFTYAVIQASGHFLITHELTMASVIYAPC